MDRLHWSVVLSKLEALESTTLLPLSRSRAGLLRNALSGGHPASDNGERTDSRARKLGAGWLQAL
nr:hypothetical protein [Gammaproteobacteria bacterium]